jgi:hypothetical protein
VKRQIIEGVQAIVKLIQHNQFTMKVPLQVFDRSAGASNVNFNEYVDLDISVAADIVLHAKNKERSQMHQSPQTQYPAPYFNQQPPYGQHIPQQSPQPYSPVGPPQYQQHQQHQQQRPIQPPNHFPYLMHQQHAQHPNPPTPAGNNSNLQQLLANLSQPQQRQPPAPGPPLSQTSRQPDLGGLLSNIAARQQNQGQPYIPPGPPAGVHGYGVQPAAPAYGTGQQSNVQNIMEQLARYQR